MSAFVFPYGILYLILNGILIGVIVSAPMGPVGVLCVQRTLNKGRWYGFATGIGAACSDMFYALITGFGMSFVNDLLYDERNLFLLQLGGSAMLLAFGVYALCQRPEENLRPKSNNKGTLWHNFWTGFMITMSNPLIILLFIALFARFAFVPDEFFTTMLGFSAIVGGALLWWFLLTLGVDKLRTYFTVNGLTIMNRIIGTVVIGASIYGFATTMLGIKSLSIIPH